MQEQGAQMSGRVLIALSAVLAAIALTIVAAAEGATNQRVPMQVTPSPTYQIPPLPTPTVSPTATPSGPKLMSPFPKVRTAGEYSRRRTRLTRVKVTGPVGATVEGRCSKQIKKCRTNKVIPPKKTVRLKKLQRSFRPKTVIRIRVRSADAIGKYVEIRIRRGKPPIRFDRCIRPGTRKPSPCPAS
jgi:hypothetical protein